MERPKVNINFNIDVKLDNKMPIEIKAQIEDAVIRAATAIDCWSRMGYDTADENPTPEQKPLSRHQKAVNENRRISAAIQYIDAVIRLHQNPNHPPQDNIEYAVNLKHIKRLLLE